MNALVRKALSLAPPAVIIAIAGPALAHHSFNMFALDQVVTVQGTVKDYQFKMPHVWFYMVIPTKTGVGQEEWGFECHSPNLVARKGWNLSTLKPGDHVVVTIHPLRSGEFGGSFVQAQIPDGRVLKAS